MNETCDAHDDCTTNAYLWCNGNGICGCWHAQGAALDEDGMCLIGSTWKAKTHFALICIILTSSMLVLAYHTYATWLVMRLGAKGTIRKSAFLVELGMLCWMAVNAVQVAWYKDPSLFGARATQTYTVISRILWVIVVTGFVLGAMCQGLLWIEFVMASTRVASVSFRLKRVRRFLNISMISYVVLATLLLVLELVGFQSAENAQRLLSGSFAISVAVLFLYGSHKMAKLFARMSSNIKALIVSSASSHTSDFDTSESTSSRSVSAQDEVAAHMERQLADLREKEMRIVRSGRQLAAGQFLSFSCLAITTFLLEPMMASQVIIWAVWLGGFNIGTVMSIHAMSSYCIFSLHTTLHKLDALQKLNGHQRMQGLLDCELLTPALQEIFEGISPKLSLTRKPLPPVSIALNPATPPDNDIKSGQPPKASTSIADSGEALHAGQRVREQLETIPPLISREESSALLTRVAERIRQPSYSLKDFHADMVRCFPELQLYLGGCLPAADTVEASTAILKNKGARTASLSTSGRTGHVEYCRTFGALFCVYWLMRLKLDAKEDSEGLDGQFGFCLGVDENTWESKLQEEEPTDSVGALATEESKQLAFLHSHDWSQMQQLMIDAGMLVRVKSGGVAVCVERTRAMLVLTAIHDIMKTECLLPTVLPVHGPFNGYQAGEMIYDHDAALGYVLTHDVNALPSYADLPPAQRAPVRFTQAELCFNHGWLVQAEAPPGMLLSKFKQLLESGGMSAADVAFYFVHWLTDLAGAEGTPLAGAEKFVVKFPHVVLNSFIRSFPIVQQLATLTETELMERFLVEWWPDSLGPLPMGPEAVALMRLVVQVQSPAAQPKVVEAFHSLSDDDRATLATEMAITGIDGQTYTASTTKGGPAFLVYYSPAFLRQSVSNALAGLRVLAGVYRAARELFPLSADHGGCVIVHIDQLKAEGDIESLCATAGIGNLWMLVRKGEREAVAERYALFDNVSLTPPDEPHQVLRIGKSLLATAVTSIR